MRYDLVAVIGRFQPFHLGHRHAVRLALEKGERVIVLAGSANVARSIRNPFTFEERAAMIRAVFPKETKSGRLVIRGLDDHAYNDTAWVTAVQREVGRVLHESRDGGGGVPHGTGDLRIALACHAKGSSSTYRKMFPEWELVEAPASSGTFDATEIRRGYLRKSATLPREACPKEVVAFLDAFRSTPELKTLVAEAEWAEAYRKSWAAAPFPPVFVTVDCVVRQSGHVLLVRRGGHPGKGLLALPGGFVESGERLREAAVRELREETRIADGKGAIPPATLASFIEDAATRVFDAPERSIRGRTITHAFLFRCPERPKLYRVKGGDDASAAAWHRMGDFDPREFFEDHWFILQAMTGIT